MSGGGQEQPVTVNVSGQRFSTLPSTLRRAPNSRLARMLEGGDSELRALGGGQFFVDRDGALFALLLDYLRTGQLYLPADFSDYERLQREADFYQLPALVELLAPEGPLRPRPELLELRFLLQPEGRAFFRLFCSHSGTADALADRLCIYSAEQPGAPLAAWGAPQRPLVPVPLQRPSHHDMVFQCGPDLPTAGEQQLGARYVSIKPDQRKLMNGTNVLGLLVDILLKEGFRLLSTRTVSSEEKVECYTFERMKRSDVFIFTENPKIETNVVTQIKQTRSKKRQ